MGLWSSFKDKISSIGSGIKRGIKQGAKWAWDHREGIGKVVGAGLDVASTLGVPGANVASKIVKNVSNIGKQLGEDKFSKGLESTLKKNKTKALDNESSTNNSQPSGYSLSSKSSGGTKEGSRINSWIH